MAISFVPASGSNLAFVQGVPSSVVLTGTSSPAATGFSFISGFALPTGFTLSETPFWFNGGLGTITPILTLNYTGAIGGLFPHTFTIQAEDAGASPIAPNQTWTIQMSPPPCPPITLSPIAGLMPPPNPAAGVPYSKTIIASGSLATPYVYSVSAGVLPTWATLNPSTGVISGTPTNGAGAATFTIKATDTNGCFGTAQYTIQAPPFVPCSTLTYTPPPGATIVGTVGSAFVGPFVSIASPGIAPITYTLISGILPPGITLNGSPLPKGVSPWIGTLTTVVLSGGFTIRATDANGCFNAPDPSWAFSIQCQAMNLTPATLPNGTRNIAYPSTPIQVNLGTAPYTFDPIVGLPTGMSAVTNVSGLVTLSGTPTANLGDNLFTISGTDANGCGFSQEFNIHLCDLLIVPPTLPNGTIGKPYTLYAPITVSRGTAPYTLSVPVPLDLPPGLTFVDNGNGTANIVGTPTTLGSYTFRVDAVDSGLPACTGFIIYTIGIFPDPAKLIYFDNSNVVPSVGIPGPFDPFSDEPSDNWMGWDETSKQLCITNYNRTIIICCYGSTAPAPEVASQLRFLDNSNVVPTLTARVFSPPPVPTPPFNNEPSNVWIGYNGNGRLCITNYNRTVVICCFDAAVTPFPNPATIKYFDNSNNTPVGYGDNTNFNNEPADVWIGYDTISRKLCIANYNKTVVISCFAPIV